MTIDYTTQDRILKQSLGIVVLGALLSTGAAIQYVRYTGVQISRLPAVVFEALDVPEANAKVRAAFSETEYALWNKEQQKFLAQPGVEEGLRQYEKLSSSWPPLAIQLGGTALFGMGAATWRRRRLAALESAYKTNGQ